MSEANNTFLKQMADLMCKPLEQWTDEEKKSPHYNTKVHTDAYMASAGEKMFDKPIPVTIRAVEKKEQDEDKDDDKTPPSSSEPPPGTHLLKNRKSSYNYDDQKRLISINSLGTPPYEINIEHFITALLQFKSRDERIKHATSVHPRSCQLFDFWPITFNDACRQIVDKKQALTTDLPAQTYTIQNLQFDEVVEMTAEDWKIFKTMYQSYDPTKELLWIFQCEIPAVPRFTYYYAKIV